MKNRIYFFANFGDWNKLPLGGGEVGNRKTLKLLEEMNLEVKLIPKYLHVPNHSILNIIILGWRIFINILNYITILLFGRRKRSIVHIAGFYGTMIYFEYILVLLAKILRYRIIYEMRGGGADFYYEKGTYLYKKCFSNVINLCDTVFSQGIENKTLILKLSPNKNIFYYPNYVMDDFYPKKAPNKPADRINLIYFGRISKAKNIDIILSTFYLLSDKYNNIYLDIVGDAEDNYLLDSLKQIVHNKGLDNKICFYKACDHNLLKEYLKDKHFFIFPTQNNREGHSNALTEAMAWGVIPITTKQGFNASVIDDNNFIVNEVSAIAFAKIIEKVIDQNKISYYSSIFYNRVIDNYTDKIIFNKLHTEYQRLFKLYF